MRWVKETLPPRARRRWLLTTMRLSTSSLAGTDRTEVAVGTDRLASMFVTTRAEGPRRVVTVESAGSAWPAGRAGEAAVAGATAGAVDDAAGDAAAPSCVAGALGVGVGAGERCGLAPGARGTSMLGW